MLYPPLNEYLISGYVSEGYLAQAAGIDTPYAIIFTGAFGTWNCTKYPTNYNKPVKRIQPDERLGGGSRVKVSGGITQRIRKMDFELLTQAEADSLSSFFDLADGIMNQFTITDNVLGGSEVVNFMNPTVMIETIEYDICKASLTFLLV